MYDRINELCKKNGITLTKMCADNNISTGAYYSWKHGTRTLNEFLLKQIASYFGVTVEYLKYGTDVEQRLSEGELVAKMILDNEFIDHSLTLYELPSEDKERAFHLIDMLHNTQNRNNDTN